MTLLSVFLVLILQSALPQPQQAVPTGLIEGAIVDAATKQPVEDARVVLTKVVATNPPFEKVAITQTDGRFSFSGLEAGDYRLLIAGNGYVRQEYGQKVFPGAGSPINLKDGQAIRSVVAPLTTTGSVSGRVRDREGQPLVNMTVELMRYRYDATGRKLLQSFHQAQTNDRGEYRIYFVTPGKYYLGAGTTPGTGRETVPFQAFRGEAYDYMFYPGFADPGDASVLDVQPGSNLPAIDVTLDIQPFHRLRGRIVDAITGKAPPMAKVRLNYRDPANGDDYDEGVFGSGTYENGVFEFRRVIRGSFSVSATIEEGEPGRTGYIPVEITDSDVDALVVMIPAPGSIRGRFSVEGGSIRPGSRPVWLLPALESPPLSAWVASPPSPTMSDDGAFTMTNVIPGEYRVLRFDLSSNFFIKQARFGGEDVLSRPLRFTGSETGMLEILVSSNVAALDGTVRDEQLRPVPGAQVVLIPDRARGRTDLFRAVSTDQDGHFTIPNAVPGDYKFFALEALEPFGYFDSELLKKSETKAETVSLSELSRRTIDLEVIPLATSR